MNNINKNDRQEVNRQTKRAHQWLHILQGLKEIFYSKWKVLFPSIVLISFSVIWSKRHHLVFNNDIPFIWLFTKAMDVFLVLVFIAILLWVINMLGTPFITQKVRNTLYQIGFTNAVGEPPELLSVYKDKGNRFVVYKFYNPSIDVIVWDEHRHELSTALNREVIRAEFGNSRKEMLLFTVSKNARLENTLYWKNDYFRSENYETVLGESIFEQVIVDFNKTPHLLCAGSTGSGKSKLMKLVLFQCFKHGHDIHIVDFKGGVDFSPKWHEKFNIITDKQETISLLIDIVDIIENRKKLFRENAVANIDEFNEMTSSSLSRVIFACDEIAEMLDKSGLSKEEKELTTQIENKIAIIARTGRAFGCHLVIATQRPDANVLSGQIKNNTDFKVCGKADNVLSQIVLDNTSAADSIPKNSQGLFITNTGVIFKAYLFDEEDI